MDGGEGGAVHRAVAGDLQRAAGRGGGGPQHGLCLYRRQVRPPFAEAWDEALRVGWPPADLPWIEAAECFFEGREPPPGNPVRFASVSEVIEAMNGNRFAPRQRRGRSAG